MLFYLLALDWNDLYFNPCKQIKRKDKGKTMIVVSKKYDVQNTLEIFQVILVSY